MEAKYCRKCFKYLEINNFHKSKSRSYPDGYISVCKYCIKNKILIVKEEKHFKIIKGNFVIDFDSPDTPVQEDT